MRRCVSRTGSNLQKEARVRSAELILSPQDERTEKIESRLLPYLSTVGCSTQKVMSLVLVAWNMVPMCPGEQSRYNSWS